MPDHPTERVFSIERALPDRLRRCVRSSEKPCSFFAVTRPGRLCRYADPARAVAPGDRSRSGLGRAECGPGAVGFVWLDAEIDRGAADEAIGVAEIDVLPSYGQRGIGAALLEHACQWARAAGYRRIALGTLADVPWNAPFYAKRGFAAVDKNDPAFAFARQRDRENGFPDRLRVFMSRALARPARNEWTIWPAPAKLNLFLRITGPAARRLPRAADGISDPRLGR